MVLMVLLHINIQIREGLFDFFKAEIWAFFTQDDLFKYLKSLIFILKFLDEVDFKVLTYLVLNFENRPSKLLDCRSNL